MNPLFPDCKILHMPQRSEEWHEIRKGKLTATGMGAWLAEEPQVRITVDEIKVILDRFAIPYLKSYAKPVLLTLLPPEMLPRPTVTQGAKDARHTAICKILGSMSKAEVPDMFESPAPPDDYEKNLYEATWEVFRGENGTKQERDEADTLQEIALAQFPPAPRNPSQWAIWNGVRMEPIARAVFERWNESKITEVGFAVHKSGVAGCSPDGLIEGLPHGFEGKCPLPGTHVDYLLKKELPPTYKDQVHGSMAVTGAQGWWFQSYCPGLPLFRIYTERDDYTERMAEGLDEFAVHLNSAREEIAALWDAEFDKEGES